MLAFPEPLQQEGSLRSGEVVRGTGLGDRGLGWLEGRQITLKIPRVELRNEANRRLAGSLGFCLLDSAVRQ